MYNEVSLLGASGEDAAGPLLSYLPYHGRPGPAGRHEALFLYPTLHIIKKQIKNITFSYPNLTPAKHACSTVTTPLYLSHFTKKPSVKINFNHSFALPKLTEISCTQVLILNCTKIMLK
jgi:hypothetical protein